MIDKKIDVMQLSMYLDVLKADALVEASCSDESDQLELYAKCDVISQIKSFIDKMPDVS